MSSWDTGPFDNDGAMNFVAKLDHDDDERATRRIQQAMRSVVESRDYISAAKMNLAIASACLVGAMMGAHDAVGSPFVLDWLTVAKVRPTPELCRLSLAVFERAFSPVDNQWFSLWESDGKLNRVRRGLAPFHKVLAAAA